MKTMILALAAFVLAGASASAGTECTTRKSGSTTITTCTDSRGDKFSQCRSYRSGSVIKTTCRD
jgi:hypothetical protein